MTSVLDQYRGLQAASHRMLEAAQAGRWDEVTRLESDCDTMIAALRASPERRTMSAEENVERLRILHDIVQVDGQVRQLAQPWLGDLDRLLSGNVLGRGPLPAPRTRAEPRRP